MTIINGVEDRGRVESLLELEDLVELTGDGFRPARLSTIDSIATRLRVSPEEQLWLPELDWDAVNRVTPQHPNAPSGNVE